MPEVMEPHLAVQFQVIDKLITYLDRHLHPEKPAGTLSQGLAWAALRRTFENLRAIRLLAEHGFRSEAAAVGRIICETCIKMRWMTMDPVSRTQQLLDASTLDADYVAQQFAKAGMTATPGQMLILEGFVKDARARLGNRSLPKLLEMAQKSLYPEDESKGEEFYDFFYRILCIEAHGDVRSYVKTLTRETQGDMTKTLYIAMSPTIEVINACSPVLNWPDPTAFTAEVMGMLEDVKTIPD